MPVRLPLTALQSEQELAARHVEDKAAELHKQEPLSTYQLRVLQQLADDLRLGFHMTPNEELLARGSRTQGA